MVFGTVLEGMKFVRQIEAQNGTPPKEDRWTDLPWLSPCHVLGISPFWAARNARSKILGRFLWRSPTRTVGRGSASRVAMCCHATPGRNISGEAG